MSVTNFLVGHAGIPADNLVGDYWVRDVSQYRLNSGLISSSLDQSGHNRDIHITAGNAPAFTATGSYIGNGCMDFNTGGAVRYLIGNSFGLGSTVTIYTVCQMPASGRYICDGDVVNTRAMLNNAGSLTIYNAGFGPSISGITTGTWIVIAAVFAATAKLSVNGGTISTLGLTPSSNTGLTVGAPAGGVAEIYGLNAKLERFIIYNVAHNDTTMTNISKYLKYWAGI